MPQIVVIELSRNFGHHYAAFAGLQYSRGKWVFLIDCDLEVSPLVLIDFFRLAKRESCDVVYGYQTERKGGWVERTGGRMFWRLFNALSETPVPANVLTERLLSRRYVEALLKLGDRNLFLAGMMCWVGFNQVGQPVTKVQREGRGSYTLGRRIALLVDAVTSFSAIPLRLLFSSGLLITFVSVSCSLYLILNKLLHPEMVLIGFTAVSVLILLSLGIMISSLWSCWNLSLKNLPPDSRPAAFYRKECLFLINAQVQANPTGEESDISHKPRRPKTRAR